MADSNQWPRKNMNSPQAQTLVVIWLWVLPSGSCTKWPFVYLRHICHPGQTGTSLCEPSEILSQDQECFSQYVTPIMWGRDRQGSNQHLPQKPVETLKLLCLDVTCHTLACHSRQSVPSFLSPHFFTCRVRLAGKRDFQETLHHQQGMVSAFKILYF